MSIILEALVCKIQKEKKPRSLKLFVFRIRVVSKPAFSVNATDPMERGQVIHTVYLNCSRVALNPPENDQLIDSQTKIDREFRQTEPVCKNRLRDRFFSPDVKILIGYRTG